MTEALTGLELQSLASEDGVLRISLVSVPIGAPKPGEVIVRIEAAPINPSDLGLLFGPADPATLRAGGTAEQPALVADIPASRLPAIASRVGQSLAVGNEGCGTVIDAGEVARHLIGRRVGMIGGAMYAQYRRIAARDCIPLPEGTGAAAGASLFVNPLTALGFVETMRMEGHSAIVHTAAASNLGQMLVKICKADGVPLVNIVRSAEQAALLRGLGATHIVDSSAPDFQATLVDAIADTGATIGFDAIGGGKLASQMLGAMEVIASRNLAAYNRYGSDSFKQVYIYGALDTAPTTLNRTFGFAWSMGGWLLMNFLGKAGPEAVARLRKRVVDELHTTFASHYSTTISLAEALDPEIAKAYERKQTGKKYLIDPTR